jgi:hypothetical protein
MEILQFAFPAQLQNFQYGLTRVYMPVVRCIAPSIVQELLVSSIALSVPHRKHITSPLRAQQVIAIYMFVAMVY